MPLTLLLCCLVTWPLLLSGAAGCETSGHQWPPRHIGQCNLSQKYPCLRANCTWDPSPQYCHKLACGKQVLAFNPLLQLCSRANSPCLPYGLCNMGWGDCVWACSIPHEAFKIYFKMLLLSLCQLVRGNSYSLNVAELSICLWLFHLLLGWLGRQSLVASSIRLQPPSLAYTILVWQFDMA